MGIKNKKPGSKKKAREYKFDPDATPIWEEFRRISESIPDEEWEKLPKDGSVRYKYYLYGIED